MYGGLKDPNNQQPHRKIPARIKIHNSHCNNFHLRGFKLRTFSRNIKTSDVKSFKNVLLLKKLSLRLKWHLSPAD